MLIIYEEIRDMLFQNVFSESVFDEAKIFKNIRCLVCQGQSIADSNSEFAQTIKIVVRDQLKEGKSEIEIYNFLVSKYGEWIVYKPKLNKNNFLLSGPTFDNRSIIDKFGINDSAKF